MITDSKTWRDYITPPVLIALAGCALFFFGTFFEIGRISAFGYSVSFRLNQLGIAREVTISRVLSLVGAGVLFVPKVSRLLYAACSIGQFALFAPKVFSALRHISSAENILHALGLQNYIHIEDYLTYSAGYYCLIAGGLIIFGCTVYFLVSMFVPPKETDEQ